jgi:hypothetical protein
VGQRFNFSEILVQTEGSERDNQTYYNITSAIMLELEN